MNVFIEGTFIHHKYWVATVDLYTEFLSYVSDVDNQTHEDLLNMLDGCAFE